MRALRCARAGLASRCSALTHARRAPAARSEAVELTEEVRDLAVEAGADGAEKLTEDLKDFHDMYDEYKLKDEAQSVVAAVVGVYTFAWHFFGAAGIYASLMTRGTLSEYAARGISDAWFSIFMIASCLNNVGLSLLDDSMMPLTDRPAPLMIMVRLRCAASSCALWAR